jgi:hypothetical protein
VKLKPAETRRLLTPVFGEIKILQCLDGHPLSNAELLAMLGVYPGMLEPTVQTGKEGAALSAVLAGIRSRELIQSLRRPPKWAITAAGKAALAAQEKGTP